MLDWSTLILFVPACIILVISPGPDLLLISTYSSTKGARHGIYISLGIALAALVQTALVAFGLGMLMQTIPLIATLVKWLGITYLSWLGITCVRHWLKAIKQNKLSNDRTTACNTLDRRSLVFKGLLNNLANPKALMFFSLFLPQFTVNHLPYTNQILVLGSVLTIIALLINVGLAFFFALLGSKMGNALTENKHVDGLLGGVFLFLAARLALTSSTSN